MRKTNNNLRIGLLSSQGMHTHLMHLVWLRQWVGVGPQFARVIVYTRNTLDCDQSNYSSRIVLSHIPIEFGQKGIIAPFDPPTPKTPS